MIAAIVTAFYMAGAVSAVHAAANDYVLFQFYMFHDDDLGRRVKDGAD